MIRVVIDTNVVVSANLRDDGLPAAILDLVANKKIQMYVTEDILAEYEEVLRYPRLKLSPTRITHALGLIRKTSKIVKPRPGLKISKDPSDNRFYECAEAAKAQFLITGNVAHFPVDHKLTKIVTPREFITIIGLLLAGGRAR